MNILIKEPKLSMLPVGVRIVFVFSSFIGLFGACVRPAVFRSEKIARMNAEARESVLFRELQDRKTEVSKLTDNLGVLNKNIGNQETIISNLRLEITTRTKQLGESSGKLILEKIALEEKLSATQDSLTHTEELLNTVRVAQKRRQRQLEFLRYELDTIFRGVQGAQLPENSSDLNITLQDKFLFEPSGMTISQSGQLLLERIANFLSSHPEIDVLLEAHTDNMLPKDKNLKDTWDWSNHRSVHVVRYLIRELNVNANQLTPSGKGEFFPVTSNETPEGRQTNRRTVLILMPPLTQIPKIQE